jgi:hypothetical protein
MNSQSTIAKTAPWCECTVKKGSGDGRDGVSQEDSSVIRNLSEGVICQHLFAKFPDHCRTHLKNYPGRRESLSLIL